eukprot:gnl/Carplike_NY0171/170_a247_5567.p1 GENE.gnl/Carplike_NY0171/170_a247_5567~~gnl/Carplike_NY0171/170_a247_5567.p1  ORF type:complete len:266 (+),score=44.26 gnl/Carplike_NY0171/170_a247_5567:40-837(+)
MVFLSQTKLQFFIEMRAIRFNFVHLDILKKTNNLQNTMKLFISLFLCCIIFAFAYELDDLPYEIDALEPYYPGHVIEVHRRHHVGYCKKSTAALVGTALEGFPIEYVISHLEELPVEKRQILKNVGGGLANHTFFWQCLSPNMGQRPKGKLLNQIELDFGSFESFWGEFSSSLSSLFGSGWTWLVYNTIEHNLEIMNTANQDSPINNPALGLVPILNVDGWEHAWYLYCENNKGLYIETIERVLNWEFAGNNFEMVISVDAKDDL